jgi:imidazolonepropionase-like amidohydrolase
MILFEHADILDAASGTLLKDRFVLVEGDTISRVSEQPISAPGARVVDARGRVLMPGLIDCHVHVLASMLNIGRLARMPNVLAVLRAVPILRGMLMRGFTTVRDAGGADWSLAEAVRTGTVQGPRIFPAGRALSQTGGHGDFRERSDVIEPCPCTPKVGAIGRVVDGVDAIRRAVREEIQMGATQIKIMASGGVASPTDPIHYLGFSEDEVRAAVEEASNADTYVMAHAYTGRAIARAVRCGVRTIEHGNLVDAEAARVMADHGAIAVPRSSPTKPWPTKAPRSGCRRSRWPRSRTCAPPGCARSRSTPPRACAWPWAPTCWASRTACSPTSSRCVPAYSAPPRRCARPRSTPPTSCAWTAAWAWSRRGPQPTCCWWTATRWPT